jgi:hypothetical protein
MGFSDLHDAYFSLHVLIASMRVWVHEICHALPAYYEERKACGNHDTKPWRKTCFVAGCRIRPCTSDERGRAQAWPPPLWRPHALRVPEARWGAADVRRRAGPQNRRLAPDGGPPGVGGQAGGRHAVRRDWNGLVPTFPFLGGAKSVLTIDLHRHLQHELTVRMTEALERVLAVIAGATGRAERELASLQRKVAAAVRQGPDSPRPPAASSCTARRAMRRPWDCYPPRSTSCSRTASVSNGSTRFGCIHSSPEPRAARDHQHRLHRPQSGEYTLRFGCVAGPSARCRWRRGVMQVPSGISDEVHQTRSTAR